MTLAAGLRVAIVGGSTAAGLGAGGRSFAALVVKTLTHPTVLDLSLPGRMVDDHVSLAPAIREFQPDLALVCVGASESLVHPGPRAQRLIERWAPPSWHGVNAVHPPARRLGTELRSAVKRSVIRLSRGRPRMAPEDFGRNLHSLLGLLEELSCKTIVIDLWHTDDKLFPGTDQAFQAASREIMAAVEHAPSAVRLPLREALRYWEDFQSDHLHLSSTGQRHVADLVLELLPGLTSQVP